MTVVASHGALVALVRERGGLSRAQLLEETGMSRGTLVTRLDALTRNGLVYEGESLGATGGRRARRIRFDDRGRVVLTVDIGQTHVRVSVTDLAGTELRFAELRCRLTDGPDAVLGPALDAADALLAGGGPGERPAGVGIGIPAAVDPATGMVLPVTPLPGWAPGVVVATVGRRWGLPVVVENDARAAAVGESRSDDETLVAVKVATGIGCGIVVGGDVMRGAAGIAGDIGHVRVGGPAPEPVCRCGRHGCLAAYSSGRALLGRLGGDGYRTLDDLVAGSGRPRVGAELAAAADVLGAALATTVTTVNPHRVVLGGVLGELPAVVDGVRTRILDAVSERARPVVEASTLGPRAIPLGLARLVARTVFAPEAVDRLVAG
ncbi:ROK family transcriptional regulator [Pseudonocardia sp. NPDC046786]|uniref:ROK family transcriptional regulator n=1 Tax=Pseudonocardia sp. NPDC046786 TaxID=3155471 RepID=UPI00340C2326